MRRMFQAIEVETLDGAVCPAAPLVVGPPVSRDIVDAKDVSKNRYAGFTHILDRSPNSLHLFLAAGSAV